VKSKDIARIAIFSALIVSSNYMLISIPQFKLMDGIIFLTALMYGTTVGISIAILSWMIYGTLNPMGSAGFPLIIILITGQMFYVFTARVFKNRLDVKSKISLSNIKFGIIGMSCALAYDIWTNFLDGLIIYGTIDGAIIRIISGIPFSLVHQWSNFIIFSTLIPIILITVRSKTEGTITYNEK